MAEPSHIAHDRYYTKLRILAKQLVEHGATRLNHLLAGNGAGRLVFQRGWGQEYGPGGGELVELPK